MIRNRCFKSHQCESNKFVYVYCECIAYCLCRDYIYGNLMCEPYNLTGFCSPYLGHLSADIIVNYSRVNDQSGYATIANTLGAVLRSIAHQKCLELILPLLCRYVFVTCDPAYNTSVHQVYQPICRHGCDVVSLFACPVVWQLLLTQLSNLQFGVLDPPLCDPLGHPNAGDIPDCVDTTDGGKLCSYSEIYKQTSMMLCIIKTPNLGIIGLLLIELPTILSNKNFRGVILLLNRIGKCFVVHKKNLVFCV